MEETLNLSKKIQWDFCTTKIKVEKLNIANRSKCGWIGFKVGVLKSKIIILIYVFFNIEMFDKLLRAIVKFFLQSNFQVA